MTGVERQVLELVALVDEQVVDAHLLEVRHVVRSCLYGVFHLFEFRLKVDFPFLQSTQHGS